MRWRLILEEFSPELVYIKGSKNVVADQRFTTQTTGFIAVFVRLDGDWSSDVVLLTMTPSTRSLLTTDAISFNAESVKSGAIFTNTGFFAVLSFASRAFKTFRNNELRCLRPCKFLNPGVFGLEMFTTM